MTSYCGNMKKKKNYVYKMETKFIVPPAGLPNSGLGTMKLDW